MAEFKIGDKVLIPGEVTVVSPAGQFVYVKHEGYPAAPYSPHRLIRNPCTCNAPDGQHVEGCPLA